MHPSKAALALAGLVALLGVLLGACGTTAPVGGSGALRVVAGENFWGSIAAQLGGTQVRVTSVVSDPNADPHQYASDAATARAFADAGYVILNGAGYDGWAQQLLDANPASGRKTLNVATLLGKRDGDNPHFWYNPVYVTQVADRITADYTALDPAAAGYFAQQRAAFATALGPYQAQINTIKTRFAGRSVGATESIFVYMAQYLGLQLISPPAFMNAVAEGNDPPADAVATFEQQVQQRQISVLVYNVQTVSDVTTTVEHQATQQHIPLVPVSETMAPANTTFQAWQTAQLAALAQALAA